MVYLPTDYMRLSNYIDGDNTLPSVPRGQWYEYWAVNFMCAIVYDGCDAGDAETQSEEKANHVRVEYEKRLSSMQVELRKLEAAKMEHLKLLRNQSHTEKQLKAYEHDLSEMKKLKVQLHYTLNTLRCFCCGTLGNEDSMTILVSNVLMVMRFLYERNEFELPCSSADKYTNKRTDSSDCITFDFVRG